jgi:hypothetical protein
MDCDRLYKNRENFTNLMPLRSLHSIIKTALSLYRLSLFVTVFVALLSSFLARRSLPSCLYSTRYFSTRLAPTFPSLVVMPASSSAAPSRKFCLEDSQAIYTLAEESSRIGKQVKHAIGVIDLALKDYG